MELMKTRRFVRRALLAAAVTTSSIQFSSVADAFQAAQQQGKPSPPPAGTVEQELQKLFNESGQPMPPMKQNELPNAQQPVPNTVRPKAPTPPAKKNFLQKFVGKITGQEKKEAEAAVVPPVPPDFKEPAPAPPSGNVAGNVAQTRPTNNTAQPKTAVPPVPANRQPQQNAQVRNGQPQNGQPNNAQPQNRAPANAPQKVAQAAPQTAARPQQVPMQKGMPVPRTQPGAATAQNAPTGNPAANVTTPQNQMRTASTVGAQNGANRTPSAQVPVTAAPNAQPVQPKFVQPGSSPAFMPQAVPAPAAIPGAAVNPANTVPKQVPAPAAPNDDFQDPFEGSEPAEPSDSLDLDSLIIPQQTEPKAEETPAQPAVTPQLKNTPETTAPRNDAPVEQPPVKPFTEGEEEAPKPEENPFTGVRLNNDELEVFQQDQKPAAEVTPAETVKPSTPAFEEAKSVQLPPAEEDDMLGTPVPPVEDFDPNLPAIALPPVEETETEPVDPTKNPMLIVPDLDNAPVQQLPPVEDEATAPSELATTPNAEQKSDSLMIPSAETPAPLKNAETERLQQAAEQERRLRQQRLIQSRADRTGFKGFCPVALRDRRDLVDAQSEYSATFGLQTYEFSSAEAKAAFESDPSRYAPAAGGNDVVVLVNSGEEQSGMLDFALWYRDRLYLFRSRETMTLFNKDPQKYANQY